MDEVIDEQTELLRYLYDLQGYVVIEDVLSQEQVKEINRLLDERIPTVPDNWASLAEEERLGLYNIYRFGMAGGSYPSGPGYLEWGAPFVELLDHPAVMDLMRWQLGDYFRLDRIFGMRMLEGMPSGRLHSDYGASEPFSRAQRGVPFQQPMYQALHGFAVAVFNLADSGPATGGLRVIPGSHNSRLRLPKSVRRDQIDGIAVCPHAPAGSVTIFSEATTHGTQAWTAPHERRSLLYKYCTANLTWSRTRVTAPPDVTLTPRQEHLLAEPAGGGWFFPSVFENQA